MYHKYLAHSMASNCCLTGHTHVIKTFTLLMGQMHHMEVAKRPSTFSVSSRKPASVCEFQEASSNCNYLYSHRSFHSYCYKDLHIILANQILMWHAVYEVLCVPLRLEKARRYRGKGCHLQTEAGQSWVCSGAGLH